MESGFPNSRTTAAFIMLTIVTSNISSVAKLIGEIMRTSRAGGIDSSQSCRVPPAIAEEETFDGLQSSGEGKRYDHQPDQDR